MKTTPIKPRLPHSPAAAWPGGFILPSSDASSVAASGGTVLVGGSDIHLLRPGATRFLTRPLTTETGDAWAVAVEPRRHPRLAFAGIDSLTLLHREARSFLRLPPPPEEPRELAWRPSPDDGPPELLLLFADGALLHVDSERATADVLDFPPIAAMTADPSGAFGFACFDEEAWDLDVYLQTDARSGDCLVRHVDAPPAMSRVWLAIAGDAMAVSFEFGDLWISLRRDRVFEEIEGLGGGPVAFEGTDAGAALFAAVPGERIEAIVRVESDGAAARIAEVECSKPGVTCIDQLAWDESRRTLWAAAGLAGVLCATAPGAPLPLGASAAS